MPFIGDVEIETTYAAVGRALTRWESVELGVATLYSVFVGQPFNLDRVRQFGLANTTFVVRLGALKRAAAAYFVRHCNQDNEGDFSKICARAETLSEYRNNIAHGIVHQVTYFAEPEKSPVHYVNEQRFMLQAPWYTRDRLRKITEDGLGSAEILAMSEPFAVLTHDLEEFIRRLQHPRPTQQPWS